MSSVMRAIQQPSEVLDEGQMHFRESEVKGDLRQLCADAQAALLQSGYIQFHPVLAELAGGFKPALMLGHALYWTRHWLQRHPERDGWFWKTAKEWRDATGLTQREQEKARGQLSATGIWHERLSGSPARLHFRLDLDCLVETLSAQLQPSAEPEQRRHDLSSLLGVPVVYFRPLADLAGGAAAGLVLSHLIALQRTALQREVTYEGGYFVAGVEEMRVALGLGIKVQRNAREALKRAGFVCESWTQEQCPRLLMRVNVAAILACIEGQEPQAATKATRRHQRQAATAKMSGSPSEPGCLIEREANVVKVIRLLQSQPDSPRPESPARPPRVAALSKLRGPALAKGRPFRKSRVALLSNLYSKPNYSNTPTVGARDGERLVASASGRSSRSSETPKNGDSSTNASGAENAALLQALICPSGLDPADHDGARRIVSRAPKGLWQPLLDELAAHLSMRHKVIESPLGWLNGITKKAVNGELVLTLSHRVVAARAARARYDAALASAAGAPNAATTGTELEGTRPATVSKETVVTDRARLQELRNQLRARCAGGAQLTSTSTATRTDLALSPAETTHNRCALSQDEIASKGRSHVTHEGS